MRIAEGRLADSLLDSDCGASPSAIRWRAGSATPGVQDPYRPGLFGNLKDGPAVDELAQLDLLTEIAEELGVRVRREPIDGEGGGLCRIKGQQVLFIDTLADVATRVDRCLEALARLPGIDDHYLRPDIREQIEHLRRRGEA